MKLKAKNLTIKKSIAGDTELTFSVADKDNKIANAISEDNSLKDLVSIEFKKWRESRSLNANAYFHLLVNKIAKKLNKSDSEVKIELNLEYGTVAKDETTGELVVIKIPKSVDITQFYDYAKWFADKKEDNTSYYYLYKQTHTLNTKEMAELITGVIYEAQQLGIETITPKQKAEMMSLWESRK